MKKAVKILVILVSILILVLVIALAGISFFIGDLIKKGVETVGPKVTQVDVKLGSASLSLLGGGSTFSDLVVGNPQGYKSEYAIKVGKASLGIVPGSLLSDKIVIKSIQLHGPQITLEGGLKDNNLTQIQKNIEAFISAGGAKAKASTQPTAATDQAAKGAERKLQVDDLLVRDAKINAVILGNSFNLIIPDIHISNLGQGPDGITAGDLTKRLFTEILNVSIRTLSTNATDLSKFGTDALKNANLSATNAIDKATRGLGNLFDKK